MNADTLLIFGGIGLFLLGMVVLTEGLRRLAGDALRRILSRFTRTPSRGVAAGALTTAVVQSSSATTVIAVGFVGAGLLSFQQGLGIILGANVGTTVTGWIVAIVGFKLKLGLIVLPLVLVGVLLRLFGNGRLRHVGWALAGFCLLFVGIDAMQQGMAQFEGVVTPADFPGDGLVGRLQLLLFGVAITLVTQSSSAGVAAALVALSAGTISFEQAAAMVIGMDVGTTFTAALATLGGSTAMRRTGFAHVIYNLLTGIMAFFLLEPFSLLVAPWIAAGETEIALVAFHSSFNAIGVLGILPFTGPFARLVSRLVPERGPALLHRLDARLLRDPASAVDAVVATIREIAFELMMLLKGLLAPGGGSVPDRLRMAAVEEALAGTRSFVGQIRSDEGSPQTHRRHLAAVHALDHLLRLASRCRQAARIETLEGEHRLRRLSSILHGSLIAFLKERDLPASKQRFDRLRQLLRAQRGTCRERMVEDAARQRVSAVTTLRRLDSVRWLHRVSYHLWRTLHHLHIAEEQALTDARFAPSMPAEEPDLELEED